MIPIGDRRSAPSDASRDLHRRLAVVLADLTFPVQRWQLIAGADLYGADTVTRAIIERAPEQRYQTLSEVVAALTTVLGGRPVAPVPAPATPSRPVVRAVAPSRGVPPRRDALRRVMAPSGSPRPAA